MKKGPQSFKLYLTVTLHHIEALLERPCLCVNICYIRITSLTLLIMQKTLICNTRTLAYQLNACYDFII